MLVQSRRNGLETTAEKERRRTQIDLINNRWLEYPPARKLVDDLVQETAAAASIAGLAGSSFSFLVRTLSDRLAKPILIVSHRSEEARDLVDDLTFLMGADRVGHYPTRQILPYDFKAPLGEVMGRRISTLSGLLDGNLDVTVCPIRAVLEPTIDPEDLRASRLQLSRGVEADLDELVNKLVKLGFRRVPVVEEIGDFSLRGGLVDFFSPGAEAPVRVELFGDEVETIREFDVATQRTLRKINHVSLLPKREIPITLQTLEGYVSNLPDDDADYIRRRYLNDPELPGLEWLSVIFGIKQGCLLDYISGDSLVIFEGEGTLRAEADAILAEAWALHERLKNNLVSLPPPEEYYHSPDDVFDKLKTRRYIDRLPFRGGRKNVIDFGCQPHPVFASRLDLLGKSIREFRQSGVEHFIATDTPGQAVRLGELIAWAETAAVFAERVVANPTEAISLSVPARQTLARIYGRQAALKVATDGLQWAIGGGQTNPNLAGSINLPGIYQAQDGMIADMDLARDYLNKAFV